ncbi:MAG: hypothetical protein ACTHJQ_12535 [Rhizobiaceae bacterium]
MKRYILVSLVSAYLGAGLFAGLLMQRAVAPLNPLGVAFIAVTWPNQIRCARISSGCDAIPAWASSYIFTFSEPTHGN